MRVLLTGASGFIGRKLLMNEDIDPETLREQDAGKMIPPLHGALIKNEQDVHLFERLAFLARRERN